VTDISDLEEGLREELRKLIGEAGMLARKYPKLYALYLRLSRRNEP